MSASIPESCVTDNETESCSSALDEIAAEIRALIGTRNRESRSCFDSRNAHCQRCGRALAPNEPIYRDFDVRPGFIGWSCTKFWVCKECNGWRNLLVKVWCKYCDRPMIADTVFRFCCNYCRSQYHAERARADRASRRTSRPCAVCGHDFTPHRTDATTCSPACRQKAYRLRKAQP